MLTGRDFSAAIIAPLAAAPSFTTASVLADLPQNIIEGLSTLLLAPVFIQLFSYPVAVFAMFVLGLPLHFLLRLAGITNYTVIGLSGGPVVLAVFVLGGDNYRFGELDTVFIACGAGVSAAYGILSEKFNEE